MAHEEYQLGEKIGRIEERVDQIFTVVTDIKDLAVKVDNHEKTIAMLTKVTSDNSGIIKSIQDKLKEQDGINRIVDELQKQKCDKDKQTLETKKDIKSFAMTIINSGGKVIAYVTTLYILLKLGAQEVLKYVKL